MTPERQAMASMTVSVSADNFYLITLSEAVESDTVFLFRQAAKIFAPLTNDLWAGIGGATLWAAVCLFFVEDVGFFQIDEADGKGFGKDKVHNWLARAPRSPRPGAGKGKGFGKDRELVKRRSSRHEAIRGQLSVTGDGKAGKGGCVTRFCATCFSSTRRSS
jgi:hypothetical protein